MSFAIIFSRASFGITSPLVTVEAHITCGLPRLSIVGLPETVVKESKDRVRSALLTMHFEFPPDRITINLAPADLPKEGSRFDLPIALSILAASRQIPSETLSSYECVGELGLGGEIRSVQGTLPVALQTKEAQRTLIIPIENAPEAALVKDLTVLPAAHIEHVCAHLTGQRPIPPYQEPPHLIDDRSAPLDLSDIVGQAHAKRALEIAAAGGHSLLLIGPPGTGKTMLAQRLASLLPTMTEAESLDVAIVNSISTRGFQLKDWGTRPFRSPHHSASCTAIVGGSNPPKPGEISLAHRGVLFLDELPEFDRHVLESLREPLESGVITISRAAQQCEFPANFQLIAAMNPCPCGYRGDSEQACRCTENLLQRYQSKISGPLLDRIDMHIPVPRVPLEAWEAPQPTAESSAMVRKRVLQAIERQEQRQHKRNTLLGHRELQVQASLTPEQRRYLALTVHRLQWSMRRCDRILKIARTIADLEAAENLSFAHLREALTYATSAYLGNYRSPV